MTAPAEAPVTGAENIVWDLSDLYTGLDDPQIDQDIQATAQEAEAFAAEYRGRIAALSPAELAEALRTAGGLLDRAYQSTVFANLIWTTDTEDPVAGALLQKTREHASRLQQTLVFFELEWADVDSTQAERYTADPVLAEYTHYLETTRLRKPYLLSEPEEKLLSEKAVTGRQAWVRFFGETISSSRYDWEGERVPLTTVLNKLYEPERETRARANTAITEGLHALSRQTTTVFNNVLADKASDDRLRHYPNWITDRNLSNEASDASVEALIEAVTSRYDIVARYYRLKQKLLGLDVLHEYDRYAPLPTSDRTYSWDESRDLILTAFSAFHPRVANVAKLFYDNNWIHAALLPNKRGGAYASPTVPSVHPYVFVNYQAKPRDVMTVAHELGHGIHMELSKVQGWYGYGTPLTTAETASVFGEMLVFQDLLRQESSPANRLALLTGKLEDFFATIFRQVSMNRFEDRIHTARREEGELSTDRLSTLWMESQRAMFQGSVDLTDEYAIWWSYVHHFIAVPGYVYAYAFGALLVQALYAKYQQSADGFAEQYINLLAKGGSDWPHEIVSPLGVDLNDPQFWHEGLNILDTMVSEAEQLAEAV